MTTVMQVAESARIAVRDELKIQRPDGAPWRFDIKLGTAGGTGWGFDEIAVRDFARESYRRMKADLTLAAIETKIVYPPGFPGDLMLGQTVEQMRAWIAADVCLQAGVS